MAAGRDSHQRVAFTDTSSRISDTEGVLWLQAATLVNQRVTFTDTSSRISSMEATICMHT